MTPEQWHKVEEVLQGALDRAPQERASFVDAACDGDEQLVLETTSLINAFEAAGDFIEEPALAKDASVLVGQEFDEKIGSDIGRYRILQRLGVGGMGVVYLAEDLQLHRRVALKILPAYFASDDARLRRFQREARAVSSLNHPNILTIHEVGEVEGLYFIATEFIAGQTLRELAAERSLSSEEILNISEQIVSALAAAHADGIVHRDIKPENIMRRDDGLVKILDFGIAKLTEPLSVENPSDQAARTQTEAGLILGTVNYMSPEQARGLVVDERADIWSFGVVLYELLSKQLPFSGATRMDTLVSILEREPEIPERSGSEGGLFQIAAKCLNKDAAGRYQTAGELLSALKNVSTGTTAASETLSELTQSPSDEVAANSGRRKILAAAVIAVIIAGLTAAIFSWRSNRSAPVNPVAKKLYKQMNEAEQLAFIRDEEQRISAMMGDRPAKLNDAAVNAIKRYVDHYLARDQKISSGEPLKNIYGRAPEYVPLIAREFKARKVPVIIGIYLPVVESAYRPCFENQFGSKGLFQFLPQTARLYGVSREEMCDVKKMAPAAAQYIADHMAELGDDAESMTLVLLSYNRGAEWVRENLREVRSADDYERNFWTLLAHQDKLDDAFRRESSGYVPNFFAAAIIGENPEVFELPLAPLSELSEQ